MSAMLLSLARRSRTRRCAPWRTSGRRWPGSSMPRPRKG